MTYTYKIQSALGLSIIVRSDDAVIPEDPNNSDYQDFLAWQKQGNDPEVPDIEPKIPIRHWDKLSAALYGSSLYQEHLRQATKGASPELADRLWWSDKDLTTILTSWVSAEDLRINQLEFRLRELIKVLSEAGFPLTANHRTEVTEALKSNGFDDIAARI